MSGLKKFMHKVKEKMDIGDGHHEQEAEMHFTKDAWPGVEHSGAGKGGAPQDSIRHGTGQTTVVGQPKSAAGIGKEAHKATDASRLTDAPPLYQDDNKLAPITNLSGSGTGQAPKVMVGGDKADIGGLGKSPVYSPLGSSAQEKVGAAKPPVTDVGAAVSDKNLSAGMQSSGHKQPFSGTLPHIGDANAQPKLKTSDIGPVSFEGDTETPAPQTHPVSVGATPKLATGSAPMSSAGNKNLGGNAKTGTHMDNFMAGQPKAGSDINRSPNLAGDMHDLGKPTQGRSYMDELKDAKTKAGSAVNRSPNLTGDTEELGRPAQEVEGTPKPLVEEVSPPYNPSSKDTTPKDTNKDYTSALDKIADDQASGTGESKGMMAAAAEYVASSARSVADTAHQYKTGDVTVTDKTKEAAQIAADKAKAAGQAVADTAAQGTQAAQDAVKPYTDAAAEKAKPYTDAAAEKAQAAKEAVMPSQGTTDRNVSGSSSTSGKRVTTPADDKSYVQQAKETIAAAAAVTAETASQAYQAVQDKAYEMGVPQKVSEHTTAARDTAAAKYDELTTTAQKHQQAVQEVAADKLAAAKAQAQDYAQTAKAQAQDYVQTAQQKAAEHVEKIRNATPEDVNRSSAGRMLGGILLLWLASYVIGIPFKYGLAGALLAVSAVLFADWDNRSRRSRRSRRSGGSGSTSAAEKEAKIQAESIPTYGTPGGLDAKTGAPPASITSSSISDVSSASKQNFPEDPISSGLSHPSATQVPHAAAPYGGSAGLASAAGAGPTSATGLSKEAASKSSSDTGFDSSYRTTQPAHKVEHLKPTAAERSAYATKEE